MLSYVSIPSDLTQELVVDVLDGERRWHWSQLSIPGSKREVGQSIAGLTKRAPWALFGYMHEARDAMAAGRRLETTHEVEARRRRMSTLEGGAELREAMRLAGMNASRPQRCHALLAKGEAYGLD